MLNRNKLYYSDYKWSTYAGNHPKISGPPDDTYFNRIEGHEVLYMINSTATNTADALKVEMMIRNKLPHDISTQEQVKEWITMNW